MNAIPEAHDYTEVGADAPEPDGYCTWCAGPCCCDAEPPERDDPQGGEHYIECDMREERDV